MIDLHTHTTASDGTFTPEELVAAAQMLELEALAITDHETFAGFEAAEPQAREINLDLLRGIELNTYARVPGNNARRNLHLLAYFPFGAPFKPFTAWLDSQQASRRERNQKLIASLQRMGVPITLEEVERIGRSVTGRPHMARVLIEKGIARDHEDAFRRFLGEESPGYVERQTVTTEEAIEAVCMGGGIPVVAHPVRLSLAGRVEEREMLKRLKRSGLVGLEVIHSDQPPDLQQYYMALAQSLELVPTGGSDFHGALKPRVQLGRGVDSNVRVPKEFLDRLRSLAG
ncbi:MAG TPA: PHP domain-containing protein [Bryobacteraceae bacterium]|nr:PHP domain-containing protein [Bryobacteraceae bacterium]